MSTQRADDQFTAEFRAKLHSAQVEIGYSLTDLAPLLSLDSVDELRDYFTGRRDMPVQVLYRFAQAVKRPIWWFFGEQPATISVENAETAIANLSRVRLYLDAIQTEFQQVIGPSLAASSRAPLLSTEGSGPVVVDFAPYLSRARAILARETEFDEDSEEVFEESVEMIAHSLYSIEMAKVPSREFHPTSTET